MLKIVVPVKQVPDMSQVRFNIEKGTIDRSSAAGEINPFDLYALEAAVAIKEGYGGTVTVISMGPKEAESSVRDALSRGADRGVLLTDGAFAGADTLATSYTLASAVRRLGEFDLIICGEKTVDGDTGQVGPELAEHLGIPHIAYVFRVEINDKKLIASCDMESERYEVESTLPLLIAVTKDINTPRLPAFRDKLKAKQAKIEVLPASDLAAVADADRFGATGSPTRVMRITIPTEEGRRGRVFRECNEEAIGEIIKAISGNSKA